MSTDVTYDPSIHLWKSGLLVQISTNFEAMSMTSNANLGTIPCSARYALCTSTQLSTHPCLLQILSQEQIVDFSVSLFSCDFCRDNIIDFTSCKSTLLIQALNGIWVCIWYQVPLIRPVRTKEQCAIFCETLTMQCIFHELNCAARITYTVALSAHFPV